MGEYKNAFIASGYFEKIDTCSDVYSDAWNLKYTGTDKIRNTTPLGRLTVGAFVLQSFRNEIHIYFLQDTYVNNILVCLDIGTNPEDSNISVSSRSASASSATAPASTERKT